VNYLQFAAIAVLIIGSTAWAKMPSKGKAQAAHMVSIVNRTDRPFEKVIFTLQFTGQKHGARLYHNWQGYVALYNLKPGQSSRANLYNAITHRCQYPHKRGDGCGKSMLVEHYDNDPKNVAQIAVRHVSAGRENAFKSRMKAQGAFVRPITSRKGSMANKFEIVEKGTRIIIREAQSRRVYE
jgi:hypothetical protein